MREQGLEAAPQQVLRLLGEASTMRNQLAHIEEYLASNERDRNRARKEEEGASADLARLAEQRQQLQTKLGDRQMQLESLADQKKRVEEDCRTEVDAGEARRQLKRCGPSFRGSRRGRIAEEIRPHRAYTTESVKRRHGGDAADGVASGVWTLLKSTGFCSGRRVSARELEYVVVKDWSQADSGIDLMRGDLMAGRRSWPIRAGRQVRRLTTER
jgi:hypothetical protein